MTTLRNTAARTQPAEAEDGPGRDSSYGLGIDSPIIASPRPPINTIPAKNADVNTSLRGAVCVLCNGPARCVRAGSRAQIWKCCDETCGVEFGVHLPGRLKRKGVSL